MLTILFLEYQGGQHFRSIDFFDKTRNLQERLDSDYIKYQYSIELGIPIFYIFDKSDYAKDYLTNPIYRGMYTKENVFFDIQDIINIIDKL